MKSIFRYIIFLALSASAVLASCSKDTAVEGNPGTSEENQGLRTIILQFSPDTKAFVGIKSSFVNGDEITLSNTTESEVATVSVANGVASITTSLTGNLTAVYPSTAANVTGTGGPVGDPAYIVPAVQDGTMGDDSIIAVADITGPSAVFELLPAMEITTTTAVPIIKIKSLKTIVSGARTGAPVEINTDGTDKTVITVNNSRQHTCYVILRPGVKLTDLSFDAGEAVGMKGIPESTVTSRATALGKTFDELNVVAIGNAYQISSNNWHPYVTIDGLKWATRNIGATADTGTGSYGTYFSWGSVEKVYSLSGTTFTFQENNPDAARYTGTWNPASGFADCNTPYYNSSTSLYDKYNSSDGKTVLDLIDDAAYANWGGPWRMPTKDEFGALKYDEDDPYSSEGFYLGDDYDKKMICLPFAHCVWDLELYVDEWYSYGEGRYWSSSFIYSVTEYYPIALGIHEDVLDGENEQSRYIGCTIRPVAD